jgi:osmotically-inducible protein OsmY
MRSPMKNFLAALVSSLLAGPLGGCATWQDARKCGLEGCPGDKETAAQVEIALHEAPGVSFWDITVTSLNQTVYLSGLVDTNPERVRIEQIARQASSGKKVVDSIELRSTAGH